MAELWDIYDSRREPANRTEPRGSLVIGDYHIVVNVWLMNLDGEILVTRRHFEKSWGNYWECIGGSLVAGENSRDCAVRKVKQEIGLELDKDQGILLDSCRRERDFLDTWFFTGDFDFNHLNLDPTAVAEARIVNRDVYHHMRQESLFLPIIPDFFSMYDSRIKTKARDHVN